ncbi:MAG: hypothetical protein KJ042_12825, partial [Deltaproteobacteria bacterium]|nr:hypothetical protein [Deltaproteobacteria bacterium]
MENSNSLYLFTVSFLLVFVFWAFPALGDWRISHVAPGQSLGMYAPQRMILSDPDSGEIHIFFYGHAVTHAIVNGDDVEWDIVDPSASGRGPITAAWTQDGRLGVAWADVITRRVFVAVTDENGEWDVRMIDEGAAFPSGWAGLGLAFDEEGEPLVFVLAYNYAQSDGQLRLLRGSETPGVLFEQAGNFEAELVRAQSGDVWFMYTSSFGGGLGAFDPVSGLIWEDWPDWPLTLGDDGGTAAPDIATWPNGLGIGGVLVRTTEEYIGGEGDTIVYCRSLRHFESEAVSQFQDLPLPFDMPDRIDS